jgi:hypothetical protein
MVAAGMSQNQAASVIKIDAACVSRWRGLSLDKLPASSGEELSVQRHVSTQDSCQIYLALLKDGGK